MDVDGRAEGPEVFDAAGDTDDDDRESMYDGGAGSSSRSCIGILKSMLTARYKSMMPFDAAEMIKVWLWEGTYWFSLCQGYVSELSSTSDYVNLIVALSIASAAIRNLGRLKKSVTKC